MIKRLNVAFSALALGWIIYGYHRYLSSPDWEALRVILAPFEAFETFIVTSGILDLVIVVGLWAASDFLGAWFLSTVGVRPNAGTERLVLSSAAGLALLSLALTILGVANLLYRAAGWTLVGVPAGLWLLRRRPASVKAHRKSDEQNPAAVPPEQEKNDFSLSRRLAHGFLLAYIAVALAVTLFSALAPALEYDDLAYHLVGPKAFVERHRIKSLPHNPMTLLPKNVEMLFALGLLLHNDATAKLAHYLMGLLTMLGAYSLTARLFSRTAGLLAMAVLASSPLFLWEMRTAHIDVGLALYVFLSLYALILWESTHEPGWFRVIVCFLGFSLGIKYHALFALGAMACLVFLTQARVLKDSLEGAKVSLKLFLLASIGLFIPWGAINLYLTGNPIFPMLANFFGSRYWTPELTALTLHQQGDAGIALKLANWKELSTFVWQLFVEQPGAFKGNLGPFFLLFLPLIFFQRRIGREIKLLLLFSSIYAFLWLLTAQQARYLLSILPALAVVAASGLWAWLSLLSRATGGRILTVGISIVLATIAIVSLPLFGKYAMAGYGSIVMDTLPLRCLLGLESRDTYLARHIPNYPIVQFLNQIPGQKKVLFWWNTHPSVYHAQGEGSFLFSPLEPKLMGDDPRELRRLLKESGITHLIVAQFSQDSYLMTRPEGEFVRTHLKRVHQKAATVLYEFSAEPLRQETIYYDFLGHIRDAVIRMPGEPSDKASTDYRVITGDDLDHRYSLVTFPPAEVEYNLRLCEWPVLQFAVGQSIPSCSGKGVFEIWLAGENGVSGQIYSRELYAEKNVRDAGWFEERLDLREFAGQQVKILFKTKHLEGSSCLWYCWADPIILSQPGDR